MDEPAQSSDVSLAAKGRVLVSGRPYDLTRILESTCTKVRERIFAPVMLFRGGTYPRGQDQLDVTQAQAEAVMQPRRVLDHLGRETEAA